MTFSMIFIRMDTAPQEVRMETIPHFRALEG